MPTSLSWVNVTATGSAIVSNLRCPSRYVDKFIVEVYADSALTDLVASQSSATSWDGTNSNQTTPLTFSGLPLSNGNYWFRAGTGSASSSTVTWTPAIQVNLAAEAAVDSVTYGGTFTATSSGVSYQVLPQGAPTNIDHYEFVYTINDNVNFPLATATPAWKGKPNAQGLLIFGAIGAPGQLVKAYIRAVDTAGNYQFWFLFSTLTVSTVGTAGNLDQLPDGSTYARTKAAGLTAGVPDPRKTQGLVKLGSLSPAWSGSLIWQATATSASVASVTIWWNQLVIKRIDGTQTVIGGQTQFNTPIVVTGLSPSTSGSAVVYDFYPYVDDIANTLNFLAGTIGTPAYAWNDATLTADQATGNSQQMNRQDRLGLGPIQITMPVWTSGTVTSGGGGGFGGTCPRGDMKVRLGCGSIIRADEIKAGDKLITTLEYGILVSVLNVRHETCSEWIEIHTHKGSVIVHPDTHVPVEDSHDCVMAKDLTLSHLLKSRHGAARIIEIRLNREQHTRVILTCDRSKVFLCGVDTPELVIHNVRLANC